ncbi:hypothetical protein DFH07DRAFT_841369 [Mycena maculata]|uniref:YCII-related domain-containing protein n=1 Tax=Mycena maculata TaxID=230809 RepID=A0AAD7I9K4_9AGAR|nr:hypothetical protein DFH07DRAFT_841369 [Mycena maculata]
MAAPQPLQKFFVYAPDKADADRLSVRAKHLEGAAKFVADGTLRFGGVLLTPESLTGGEKKMVGSVSIYEAESIEAVRKIVKDDIYYATGVWDPERVVILPFVAGTPFP